MYINQYSQQQEQEDPTQPPLQARTKMRKPGSNPTSLIQEQGDTDPPPPRLTQQVVRCALVVGNAKLYALAFSQTAPLVEHHVGEHDEDSPRWRGKGWGEGAQRSRIAATNDVDDKAGPRVEPVPVPPSRKVPSTCMWRGMATAN